MSDTLTRPERSEVTAPLALTPEMIRLLKHGATSSRGLLCEIRSDANACGPELIELERRGYQRWSGWDPMITDEGRAAIGAPSLAEFRAIQLRALALEEAARPARRAPREDPRSDADYRSWRTMNLVCVLVVRDRPRDASIQCSKDGGASNHIFLPTRSCTVQSDSVGDFLLICVPKWLAQKTWLAGPTPDLTETRVWTKADLATWKSLDRIRANINGKIRSANRRSISNISRGNAA